MAKLSEQLQEVSVKIDKPTRTERKLAETESSERKERYLAERQKVSGMSYSEYFEYYKTLPTWLKNVFPAPSELEKYRKEQLAEEQKKVEERIKEYEQAKLRWEKKERLAKKRGSGEERIEKAEIMQNYYQALIRNLKEQAKKYISKGYTAQSVMSYLKKEPYYKKQKRLGIVEEGYKIEKGELIPFKPIDKVEEYSPKKEARLITIESEKGRKQFIKQEGKVYALEKPLFEKLEKGTEITSIKSKERVGKPSFEIKTEHYEEAYPVHFKKSVWETKTGKGEFIKEVPDVYISKGVYKKTKDYLGKPIYYTKTGEAKFVEGETKEEQIKDIEKNVYIGGFENIPLGEVKEIAPFEYARYMSAYGYGSTAWNEARETFIRGALPADIEKLPEREQKEIITDVERTVIKEFEGKEEDILPVKKLPLISPIISAVAPTGREKIEFKSFFKERGKGAEGISEYGYLVGARTGEEMGEFILSLSKPVSKTILSYIKTGITYGTAGIFTLKGTTWEKSFSASEEFMNKSLDIDKGIEKHYEKYISPIRKGYRKGIYHDLKSFYTSEEEFLKAYKSPAVSMGASALEAGITLYYGTKLLYGGIKGTATYFKKYGKYGLKPKVVFAEKTPYVSKTKPMDLLKWRSENIGKVLEVKGLTSVDDITKGITRIEYASFPEFYGSKAVSKLTLEPFYVEETWSVFNPKTAKWISVKKPKAITSEIFGSRGYAKQKITTARYVPEYRFGKIKWSKIIDTDYKFLDITGQVTGFTKSNIYFERSLYKKSLIEKDITKGITTTEYISTKPKGISYFGREIPSGKTIKSYDIEAKTYEFLLSEKKLKEFSNVILRERYSPQRMSYVFPQEEYIGLIKPKSVRIKAPSFKGRIEKYQFAGVSDVEAGFLDIMGRDIILKAQKVPVELKGEVLAGKFKPTKPTIIDYEVFEKPPKKVYSPKNVFQEIYGKPKTSQVAKQLKKGITPKKISSEQVQIEKLTSEIRKQMQIAETGTTSIVSKITSPVPKIKVSAKIVSKAVPFQIFKEREMLGLKGREKSRISPVERESFSEIQRQINRQIQQISAKTKSATKTTLKTLTSPKITPTPYPELTPIEPSIEVPVGFYKRKRPIYETKSKRKKKKYTELLSYSPTLTGVIVSPKPIQIKEKDVEKLLKTIQTGIEIRRPVKIV